jgi:hypothetical protein
LANPSLTTPNNTLGLFNHASAGSQLSQIQPVTGLVYMPGCYDDKNDEDYQTDEPNNLTATNCVAFGDQDIENDEDDYDEERVSSLEKVNSSVSLSLSILSPSVFQVLDNFSDDAQWYLWHKYPHKHSIEFIAK